MELIKADDQMRSLLRIWDDMEQQFVTPEVHEFYDDEEIDLNRDYDAEEEELERVTKRRRTLEQLSNFSILPGFVQRLPADPEELVPFPHTQFDAQEGVIVIEDDVEMDVIDLTDD